MIFVASTRRDALSLYELQPPPEAPSLSFSPAPRPRNIRFGASALNEAQASAIIAGVYLKIGQVTPVPIVILDVRWVSAARVSHARLECPSLSCQGWK